MNELIIGDNSFIDPSLMDGTFSRGLVPRDMTAFPVGSFAPPAQIQLLPRSEWSDRIRQMESSQSRLSDIRGAIPSLDQNEPNSRPARWGYCWSYATAGAWMLLRAVMNQPYVRPSAFGMAYTIKNGKDEGAWGALSLDFAIHRGIPSDAVWPNFQRRQIPPAGDPVWQDAAKYKVTDGYMELGDPVYDRDLNFDQMMTLLLNRIPVVIDLNWWGHCVVAIDPVETSPGKFGIRILNSWGDGWSERGMGILTGSKAIPDNAVAPSVVLAT